MHTALKNLWASVAIDAGAVLDRDRSGAGDLTLETSGLRPADRSQPSDLTLAGWGGAACDYMIDFACVSSTTPTWSNDPRWCIPGIAATEAEQGKLAADRASSAPVQGVHRYYPFVVENRGRLGKSALTVVYIFAVLLDVRNFHCGDASADSSREAALDAGDTAAAASKYDVSAAQGPARHWACRMCRALTPRWWKSSPVDLAMARVVLVCAAAAWLAEQPDFVHSDLPNALPPKDVFLGRAAPLAWRWPSSFTSLELRLLQLLLLLALAGVMTPVSLLGAGSLMAHYRAVQKVLTLGDGRHADLFAPVLLLLAGSPCADVLSVDACLLGRLFAVYKSKKQGGAGGGWRGALRRWAADTQAATRVRSRAYSAPLVFSALYIGLIYLSSGLAKARWGPIPGISWATSGFLRSNMASAWLRRWGEPRVPSAWAAVTAPIQSPFRTYLLPIFRLDLLPGFLELGAVYTVIWECAYWYLMLCGPTARAACLFCTVVFHVMAALAMAIDYYQFVAVQLALFLPWGRILDGILLRRCLGPGVGSGEALPRTAKPTPKPPTSSAPGIRDRPLVWITIALGSLLLLGQGLDFFPSVHRLPRKARCFPFEHGPSFASHGEARPAGDGSDQRVWVGKPAEAISRHMVLHLPDNSTARYPVWQAICIIGGYKEACVKPGGEVSYWCCVAEDKHYRDQLMLQFLFDPHRLIAPPSERQYATLGRLALQERALLPASAGGRAMAVSFESSERVPMRMGQSPADIMANAEMTCRGPAYTPLGVAPGTAHVMRSCKPPSAP
eukprot:jgi/Tetstr1/463578/TSEL_008457.t1